MPKLAKTQQEKISALQLPFKKQFSGDTMKS